MWNSAEKNNVNITFNSLNKRFKNKSSNKEAIIIDEVEKINENITQIVLDSQSIEKINIIKNKLNKYQDIIEYKNFFEDKVNNFFN